MILLTILFATSITFFVIRAMPGDPVETMAMSMLQSGTDYNEAYEKAKAMLNYDPDKLLSEQYVDYITSLVKLDLGDSMVNKRPVTEVIASALPWTLFVLTLSIGIAFTLGIFIGMYIAWKRNTFIDPLVSVYASVSGSLPDYIVGLLLVILLSTNLKIFPARGAYSAVTTPGFNIDFMISALYHACLPVLTYVVTGLGTWALAMKGSAVSVLGEDYIMSARARGLSEKRIRTKYVGRNAILPLVTSLTISFGMLFGGSPLVENLFAYPGVGFYLNQAIASRDYTLMQGLFLMITMAVVSANLLADLLYSMLDPRIRTRL
ncbi:MAG: ABC transporter permease [Niameybacter sp.]|uniref:ABC transporter permease n=1 Tax=Niameybacter sp. TaxID=2033640 RepID=UPI002FC62EEE